MVNNKFGKGVNNLLNETRSKMLFTSSNIADQIETNILPRKTTVYYVTPAYVPSTVTNTPLDLISPTNTHGILG